MSQFDPTSTDVDGSTTAVGQDSPELTRQQLARRVGRSPWWVGDQARRGLIPHLRKGEPPLPGRRDTRPIMFTEQQAQQIEQRLATVEFVPAGGAA